MAEYGEQRIRVADGLTLYLRDYAPRGDAKGLPVLCLHGLTRNSADFEGIAPCLARKGRRVLALDVRGRGHSDYDPDPTRYRPDVYLGDVLSVLDALSIDRAVFLGTSMGGLMTMLMAQRAPERIAAAILNDIGPVLNPAGLARIVAYVGKSAPFESWDAIIAAIKQTQAIAFPDADETFWKTFARRVARECPDGHIAFAYDPAIADVFNTAPAGPAPDLMAAFAALAHKPVLVLRGAISDILAPEGVETMHGLKPDLIVAEVPRIGHAPTLEEPVASEAISRFLQSIP